MAFMAKILSWRFRHLNIVGCLLKRRPTKVGSRVPQAPLSYAPALDTVFMIVCTIYNLFCSFDPFCSMQYCFLILFCLYKACFTQLIWLQIWCAILYLCYYSRTSGKGLHKMHWLGGRLQESRHRGSLQWKGPGTSTLWKIIYCMRFLSWNMCSSMLSLRFLVCSK